MSCGNVRLRNAGARHILRRRSIKGMTQKKKEEKLSEMTHEEKDEIV